MNTVEYNEQLKLAFTDMTLIVNALEFNITYNGSGCTNCVYSLYTYIYIYTIFIVCIYLLYIYEYIYIVYLYIKINIYYL